MRISDWSSDVCSSDLTSEASSADIVAWNDSPAIGCGMRSAEIHRKTAATSIDVELHLDGTGEYEVSTGLGFLDHMLVQLSRHSIIAIKVTAVGYLHIDQHQPTEANGTAIGEAVATE